MPIAIGTATAVAAIESIHTFSFHKTPGTIIMMNTKNKKKIVTPTEVIQKMRRRMRPIFTPSSIATVLLSNILSLPIS
jgi:hypothetical protein